MKRIIIISFILVVGFPLYANSNKEKVLLDIRHGTSDYNTEYRITTEVNAMISMLKNAGFKVIVASTSGEPIEGRTQQLNPDLKLVDGNVDDYSGVILPCLCRATLLDNWHASPEEISWVKETVAKGKPIAAQKGSIIILAEAGVLVGNKYSSYMNDSMHNRYKSFRGAIYSGDGVVKDGNISTHAYCPVSARYLGKEDRTAELTKLFIEAIKE